jgi:hypothetical protein
MARIAAFSPRTLMTFSHAPEPPPPRVQIVIVLFGHLATTRNYNRVHLILNCDKSSILRYCSDSKEFLYKYSALLF